MSFKFIIIIITLSYGVHFTFKKRILSTKEKYIPSKKLMNTI